MAKFNNAKPQLFLHQPNSFMGFDKCIEVCNHHHNIQDTLITTPSPYSKLLSSHPSPLVTTDLLLSPSGFTFSRTGIILDETLGSLKRITTQAWGERRALEAHLHVIWGAPVLSDLYSAFLLAILFEEVHQCKRSQPHSPGEHHSRSAICSTGYPR